VVTLEDCEALAHPDTSTRTRGQHIDTRLTLLGQSLAHPILLAPPASVSRICADCRNVAQRLAIDSGPRDSVYVRRGHVGAADPPPRYQLYATAIEGRRAMKRSARNAAGCRVLVVTSMASCQACATR
jgi:isopentenyl diphosphate isomerase/L-lactate dehydrogenase-like FMN-dependent dehydrogenase